MQSDTGRADGAPLAETVADSLVAMILGEMSPGARLPSEAELAQRYNVSRLTMREAVKMVAGRGLLEISRGRRAVVREPSSAAFSDFLTSFIQYDPKGLFDIIELRLSLEVQSATLAARRASRPALAAIENALDGMRRAADDMEAGGEQAQCEAVFNDFDIGFHQAIALGSGNRVLIFLFEAMGSPLKESFYISRRGHALRGHGLRDTIADHERILKAISQGNPRKAADAMREHLENTESDIRAALNLLSLSLSPAPAAS